VKTSFVGYPLREGALKSNHTIMFLFPMIVLLSLGGIFGRIRFPFSDFSKMSFERWHDFNKNLVCFRKKC
jgi:hypothetical protein